MALLAVESGRNSSNTNEFFRDFLSLMKNDEFRRFREKHMSSSVDTKSSLMFMSLYETVSDVYSQFMDEDLPDEVAVSLLRAFMKKRQFRRQIVRTVSSYLDSSEANDSLGERIRSIILKDFHLEDQTCQLPLVGYTRTAPPAETDPKNPGEALVSSSDSTTDGM